MIAQALCPTPSKVVWEHRADARRQARRASGKGMPRREYLCPCGGYHITSGPRHKMGA